MKRSEIGNNKPGGMVLNSILHRFNQTKHNRYILEQNVERPYAVILLEANKYHDIVLYIFL